MTDTTEALRAELVPSSSQLVGPATDASAAAAAPLLPVAERYAASQAAPSTQRTYRSTLRSFALFCEHELQLPATVGTVGLDTVLDYTAWLQDLDEETDEPRCHPRTVAKQLSAIRGFARWLAMIPELRIDPRIPADPRQGGTAPGAAGVEPRAAAHAAGDARPRQRSAAGATARFSRSWPGPGCAAASCARSGGTTSSRSRAGPTRGCATRSPSAPLRRPPGRCGSSTPSAAAAASCPWPARS